MPAPDTTLRHIVLHTLAPLMLTLWVGACNNTQLSVEATERPVVVKPSSVATPITTAEVKLDLSHDLSVDDAQIVVRGAWGSAPGAFGQRPEGSRPGPMSLVIGDDNTIHVLDQVNRRVQRFDPSGRVTGQTSITAETTETIALAPGSADLWTLVYEPGATPGHRVERYADGQRAQQVKLGSAVQLVTGLYVTGTGAAPSVWVEERHDRQIQLVAAGRALAPAEQTRHVLGRPYRGQHTERLTAARLDASRAALIHVLPGQGTHRLLDVVTPLPLMAIHALASDRAGRIYLGLLLGREVQPGHAPPEVHRLLLVHQGQGIAPLTIQLARERTHDVFQPLAIGPDGSVYQLHTSEEGVTVRRWALPADARSKGGAR
jgi:hypothetical protein